MSADETEDLVEALAGADADTAHAALLALGKRAATPLATRLASAEYEHGWRILRCLRELGEDAAGARSRLSGIVKDKRTDPELRSMAGLALAAHGKRAASSLSALQKILADRELGQHVPAVLCIGSLGDKAAKKLKDKVDDPELFASILSMSALYLTGEEASAAKKALRKLAEEVVVEGDREHIWLLQRMATIVLDGLEIEYSLPHWIDDPLGNVGTGQLEVTVRFEDWVIYIEGPRFRGGVLDDAFLKDASGLRAVLVEVFELEGDAAQFDLPTKMYDWNRDGILTTGEVAAYLAYHLGYLFQKLQDDLSKEWPPTHAAWRERVASIEALIELLWRWTRPAFLDRSLSLRRIPGKGPGFDPPETVRSLTNI